MAISELELRVLIEALRRSIHPDLDFQLVYEKVMGSSSIQTMLFNALKNRKKAFVDIRISRKPRKVSLNFALLPEFALNELFSEFSENSEHVEIKQDLKPDEKVLNTINDLSTQENVECNQQLNEPKRKGRGKAKKQPLARSLISVLVDDTDIQLLNDYAATNDLTFSQVIRSALRFFLQHNQSFVTKRLIKVNKLIS